MRKVYHTRPRGGANARYTYGMLTRYKERDVEWIDLLAPTPGELRALMREFDLHPAIVEELTSPSVKSKVERFDHCLYLVLHFPALRHHGRAEQEIDFVLGKHYLITVRYETIDPLHHFARSFEAGSVLGAGHTHGGHLFVSMARSLYRALTHECDALREKLDGIEESIFRGREREMVARISAVARNVHDFRRTLVAHQEILSSLEAPGERLFGAGFPYHVRSTLSEEARVRHALDHLHGWLNELRETNNSLLSLKQNEVMKNLTIMAFVTFPLTLISSVFAIDARHRPIIGMEYDFWILVGLMVCLAGSFFVFFKYKKWL